MCGISYRIRLEDGRIRLLFMFETRIDDFKCLLTIYQQTLHFETYHVGLYNSKQVM
jgi:hypothetical protein